jgi:nucleoid DNA-binding protein
MRLDKRWQQNGKAQVLTLSKPKLKIMNKSELIREVHERMDKKMTMKDIDQMVDVMLLVMSEKLQNGEEVQLDDFGTFALSSSVMKSAVKVNNRRK